MQKLDSRRCPSSRLHPRPSRVPGLITSTVIPYILHVEKHSRISQVCPAYFPKRVSLYKRCAKTTWMKGQGMSGYLVYAPVRIRIVRIRPVKIVPCMQGIEGNSGRHRVEKGEQGPRCLLFEILFYVEIWEMFL